MACLLAAQTAAAGPADDAFDRGRALLETKHYPEACAAFEESLRLDFQFGTLYNVATCDEKIGRLASALKALRKVARDDVNPTRRKTAAELVVALTPRAPRLVIAIASRPPGLHVQLDGDLVDDELGVELPVDLGRHAITATVPGQPELQRSVTIAREGELTRVELGFAVPVVEPSAAHASRALPGKITLAAGGAVLVTGFVVGFVALQDWHDAEARAATAPDAANADLPHVRTLGNVSTVCVVGGAIAVAAGIYLWRSGGGAAVIAPAVGSDGAGAVLRGRF